VALTTGGSVQQALLGAGFTQCVTDSTTGAVASKAYTLEIIFVPLSWYELWNNFQFSKPIYFMFFIAAGFVTVLTTAFIWGVNRMLTKLRFPPPLHGTPFLYALAFPAVFGCMLSVVPMMFAVLFYYQFFMGAADGGTICSANPGTTPSSLCLQNIRDWQESASYEVLRQGRQQLAIFALGVWTVIIYGGLVIHNFSEEDQKTDVQRAQLALQRAKAKTGIVQKGKPKPVEEEDDEDTLPPSNAFKPFIWRRAAYFLLCIFITFMLMIEVEFSYATPFGLYVYEWLVGFHWFYYFMELFLFRVICPDSIHYAPMLAVINSVQDLVSFGAPDFAQFLLSNFVQLYLVYLQNLFFVPAINEMIENLPRWRIMLRRYVRGNRRQTREEKAKEELEWRRVNEEIELNSEGIEPILDTMIGYSMDRVGMLVNPLVYTCLLLFFNTNQMAPNYKIKENQMVYYISFAAVLIPFTFWADTFLLDAQELIHSWKIYDYLSYQRYRFTVREYRWMLHNPVVDESVSENFQIVDMMCFSSQYYFLAGMLCFGINLMIITIEAFLRLSYNPFGDPCFLLMFIITFAIAELMRVIYARMADIKVKRIGWRGLWALPD